MSILIAATVLFSQVPVDGSALRPNTDKLIPIRIAASKGLPEKDTKTYTEKEITEQVHNPKAGPDLREVKTPDRKREPPDKPPVKDVKPGEPKEQPTPKKP